MPVALDLDTLLVSSMLVTTACGMLFLFEAFHRRDAIPSRWWGVGFLCTTAAPVFYIASSGVPELLWLVVAVGNGIVITGISMIWVGAQAFNGRRPTVGLALLGPLLVTAAALFDRSEPEAWRGGIVFLVMFAAYCFATGVEFWNQTGFRYRNAAVLSGASTFLGFFYAGRAIALWICGPEDPFFRSFFGPEIATLVVMFMILISSFSLIAIGKEQFEIALQRAATRDALTDTLNRHEFMRKAELELRRLEGTGTPASLLLVDLDVFKKINDTHGHPAGDRVLVHFAETARAALGPKDLLCRYGGEEFVILLPGQTARQARVVAETIRTRFADAALVTDKGTVRPTASAGLSSAEPGEYDLERLIAQADDALYRAKAAGRNRVGAPAKAA
ncbi:GGDEF domain-containing protein [Mesorhizobium sp. L-8-10]|uniref:GGDEF domain-containing protein n=1 Tax=Mesorhizobium sp. L-8-10 TaxID=2744523 RepID=UPI001925C6D4|nr:GGDEF domain-containing protein [Mesorhizobium sp. L-8-10]BCH32342.1 GGDEF domain-containing protein [Mesorhizobium sp. L-8-10]